MAQYYFLVSLLPELQIGHVPSINVGEFKEYIARNVDTKDLQQTQMISRLIDVENIQPLLQKESIDPRGNLDAQGLKRALEKLEWSEEEPFSDAIGSLVVRALQGEEVYSEILNTFLVEESLKQKGFLGEYFDFERACRLILVALRAKASHKELDDAFYFEDLKDSLISELMMHKGSEQFVLPFEYETLQSFFVLHQQHPQELYRHFLEFKFNRIEQMLIGQNFEIDVVLGFMAQLIYVEKYSELSTDKGVHMIDMMEREVVC